MRFVFSFTAIALAFWSLPSSTRADTNMVQICTDATKTFQPAQQCINALTWNYPVTGSLVLTRLIGSSNEWANDTIWQPWGMLPTNVQYRVCPDDIPRPSPHGGINGVQVPDPCANHQVWFTVPLPPAAHQSSLTWVMPKTNVDDTPLLLADIKNTRVEYGSCGAATPPDFGTKQGEALVAGPGTQWLSPIFNPGKYCFRAYTQAANVESVASNVASETFATPPNPPGNFATSGVMIAYIPLTSKDQMTALEVGTVPAGVACDNTQYIKTKSIPPRHQIDDYVLYLVPVSWVQFLPSVTGRDIAVYAKCSGL